MYAKQIHLTILRNHGILDNVPVARRGGLRYPKPMMREEWKV